MTNAIATAADLNTANDAADIVVSVPVKKVRVRKAKVVAIEAPVKSKDDGMRAFRMKAMKNAWKVLGLGNLIVTGLSLSHVALGISIATGATAFGSDISHVGYGDYIFGLCFDAMLVAVELSLVFAINNQYTKSLFKYGPWFVGVMAVMSAALNAVAFAQHAHSPIEMATSGLFGVITTVTIMASAKFGAGLFMAASRA